MKRIVVILPASKREAANEWCLDNLGNAGTFDPSLNKSGRLDAPETHCVCNWQLSNDDYDTLRDEFESPGWAAKIAEAMPALDSPRDGKTTGAIFMGLHGLKGRKDEDR